MALSIITEVSAIPHKLNIVVDLITDHFFSYVSQKTLLSRAKSIHGGLYLMIHSIVNAMTSLCIFNLTCRELGE